MVMVRIYLRVDYEWRGLIKITTAAATISTAFLNGNKDFTVSKYELQQKLLQKKHFQ